MPRKLRIQFDGAWYHVMGRGINRKKIFFSDDDCADFLDILKQATAKYTIECHAYCLMGNHYHLIIHTPLGNLSKAMHYINGMHTKSVNKKLKRHGPLFRNRYHAILINNEIYLLRLVRYIHQNPLKANIVKGLKNYKWSSYIHYIQKVADHDWLYQREVRERFKKLRFNEGFMQFTECRDDKEISLFFENLKYNSTLTSKNDLKEIQKHLDQSRLLASYLKKNDIKIRYDPPSIKLIISITAKYFSTYRESICNKNQYKRRNLPRRTAIYLCQQLSNATHTEIAQYVGNISAGTIGSSLVKIKKDNEVLKHAEKIKAILLNEQDSN